MKHDGMVSPMQHLFYSTAFFSDYLSVGFGLLHNLTILYLLPSLESTNMDESQSQRVLLNL